MLITGHVIAMCAHVHLGTSEHHLVYWKRQSKDFHAVLQKEPNAGSYSRTGSKIYMA